MNRLGKMICFVFCCCAAICATHGRTVGVKSPDGLNEIRLVAGQTLSYEVYRCGVERVAPTPIAMEVEGRGTLGGANAKIAEVKDERIEGTVPTPVYKKESVDLCANRTTVTFEGGWKVALVARNDGVAYRFETDFGGRAKVLDETAGLSFPDSAATVYAGYCNDEGHPLECSWESVYVATNASGLAAGGETVYLPLVVKYADGVAMCVTESDLFDYPGWNMKRGEGARPALVANMARVPVRTTNWDWSIKDAPPERPLRYMRVAERAGHLAETDGSRTYPWRVFMLAPTEISLCEADIVYALASPCRIGDADWVRPGKAVWDWWSCWNVSGVPFRAGCNTATYEYYIDFAAEHGLEYVIMDEGWSKNLDVMEVNPETDVPRILKYANARGIGVILWCTWPQLVGRQDEVFAKYAALGAKGFKVDFMDRDDQVVERFLEETAAAAARWRLVLDYHGMHKPTGFSRTYPNVLNYEGVHGLENMKGSKDLDFPRNDLLSFYCRQSAGPMDFTPGAMLNMTREQYAPSMSRPGSQGTRARQMALMTLCEAPLQMMCDSPTHYLRNAECLGFMAKVPVVWDATAGLCGEMEDCVAAARRKGDVWYAAAVNSWRPRRIEVDTSFLGSGEWTADVFADGINADRDATDYTRSSITVKAGARLAVDLAPGGGWTARFVRSACTPAYKGVAERPALRLGCQLWGVKDFWFDKPDKLSAFAEIFPKVRAMGYEGVQCGAFLSVDQDGLERLIKANGLSVVDQPVSFEDVEDEARLKKTVAYCRRFGVDFVYIPWHEAKTAEGWREFCRRLDAAESRLKPYGIKVGYHHHIHELSKKLDGEYPWDILTASDGARLEMDIGPVLEAGRVPAEEIAKMRGRLPGGIHAKPVGASAVGAPGERQDWPKIVAAAGRSGVKWLVVECEQRKDTYEDIAASAKHLRPLVALYNELRGR